MAIANDINATTKAAVVWITTDLSSENNAINTMILTPSGWKHEPLLISSYHQSETPNPDCQVSISDDGNHIALIWSARLKNSSSVVSRSAVSDDGGMTWELKGDKLQESDLIPTQIK